MFLGFSTGTVTKGQGDSPVCDSSNEPSIIAFAHSIKKFTTTCVNGGFPDCENLSCMKMHETFVKDKCHTLVMKCAKDETCSWHNQAIPYSNYIGGTQTTCDACVQNPDEVLSKFEATTKRAAAVCKFGSIDEPQTHAMCQTTECHTAMKSVKLKCLSAWVRGFSWVPRVTDESKAKIGAYTKASIACDPAEASVQFASSASSKAPLAEEDQTLHMTKSESSTQAPLGPEVTMRTAAPTMPPADASTANAVQVGMAIWMVLLSLVGNWVV